MECFVRPGNMTDGLLRYFQSVISSSEKIFFKAFGRGLGTRANAVGVFSLFISLLLPAELGSNELTVVQPIDDMVFSVPAYPASLSKLLIPLHWVPIISLCPFSIQGDD
jgi:hypothetical protein